MNEPLRRMKVGRTLVALVVLTGVFASLRTRRPSAEGTAERVAPSLFHETIVCPSEGPTVITGTRAEERGLRLWERYLYDAGDGVRAIQGLQLARDCYEEAGLWDDAARTAALAARLTTRVESDYASAQLSLKDALVSERWSDARRELIRLRALTEHRADHDYVGYLETVSRKVAARAARLP